MITCSPKDGCEDVRIAWTDSYHSKAEVRTLGMAIRHAHRYRTSKKPLGERIHDLRCPASTEFVITSLRGSWPCFIADDDRTEDGTQYIRAFQAVASMTCAIAIETASSTSEVDGK